MPSDSQAYDLRDAKSLKLEIEQNGTYAIVVSPTDGTATSTQTGRWSTVSGNNHIQLSMPNDLPGAAELVDLEQYGGTSDSLELMDGFSTVRLARQQ